jgi:hypothetical protein
LIWINPRRFPRLRPASGGGYLGVADQVTLFPGIAIARQY